MENTPASRLREARKIAGYKSASAAARSFGWGDAAYRHHENDTRSFGIAQALEYARAFNVTPSWLLDLGVTSESHRVPIASFYIAAYAAELGEDAGVRTTIDQVYENLGYVMIPELRVSADEFEWCKGIDGKPPFHFMDPSHLDMPIDLIMKGYLFAWRVNDRTPRSALSNNDIIFIDSSAYEVGDRPELWLMRDDVGPFVRWASATRSGDTLLLANRAGEPAVTAEDLGVRDIVGKVIWRMGAP